jgi:hypothetical protein
MMETRKPLFFRSVPIEAAVMPLPKEETTPPVMKTYFAIPFTHPSLNNENTKAGPEKKNLWSSRLYDLNIGIPKGLRSFGGV